MFYLIIMFYNIVPIRFLIRVLWEFKIIIYISQENNCNRLNIKF